jgi:2-polyprenyl-6-methoxyphenol hydroxylase-like FAD-dependent oxidoreductase
MVEARARNREHAIVLGGSIAGLFAARILSDYFQRVTIIERDPVHDEPESRKGQPQTRHLHGVLEPARRFIRTHLSDTEKCLLDGGALVGDFGEFARWYHFDDYKVHTTIGLEGMALSRPFLEWHVRRAVLALPNISLIDNAVAESFVTDANRSRIAGANFTRRTGDETADTIGADLVVDACGRG